MRAPQIDLWLAYYEDIADERLLATYRALLTEAERAQERRFHFAVDQRRYLVTRALVRTTLSRYCAVAPQEWIFASNDHGRPHVANAAGIDAKLRFNLSHTKHAIVLGVTHGQELGVDIENDQDRKAALEVADRFFSREESQALAALPSPQQPQRFFEYWTLKESYIKAHGKGLSIPLDQFSFRLPVGEIELFTAPELQDRPSRWSFWQYRPSSQYVMAICAERTTAPTQLTFRKTIPLVGDEPIAPILLRASR